MGWLSAILGLAGLLGGGGSSATGMDPTQQKLLNETLANQTRRMNMQNPLYEAVQKLAMRLMPTAVQGTIPSWQQSQALGNAPDSAPGPAGYDPAPTPGNTNPPAPGREDPQPRTPDRDPRVTVGANGIDPTTLARLFSR